MFIGCSPVSHGHCLVQETTRPEPKAPGAPAPETVVEAAGPVALQAADFGLSDEDMVDLLLET